MKYFALVTRGSSPGSGIAVGEEEIWSHLNHFSTVPLKQSAASLIITHYFYLGKQEHHHNKRNKQTHKQSDNQRGCK